MADDIHLIDIIQRTKELISKDSLEDAISFLERQLPEFENTPRFLNYLGQLYLNKNDPSSALNYLNRSLEIQSENAETLDNIGDTFFHLENWEQAIISWKKACELDEKRFGIWEKAGNLYYDMGEYPE
ncbi:MAG: tetratricopeptide repeat protein, partial [Candidatus Heimdallarchaeota archaeon]|nr:tetratricopeptide repeat protein [Candidatus Heimdallarchaeota archaeon]